MNWRFSLSLALVMRLAVQLGVRGAEGWQSCRYMECVWVFFRGGGVHACVCHACPRGADRQAAGQRLTPDYITNLSQATVRCQCMQHRDLDYGIKPLWHTKPNTHTHTEARTFSYISSWMGEKTQTACTCKNLLPDREGREATEFSRSPD